MVQANFPGSNLNLVKGHNLRAVLRTLLYEGPLSRIQLAHKTSLSATTITNLVDELMKQGVVAECEPETPPAKRRVGRPRSALCLASTARYAIGVHFRVGMFRLALVDLQARVIECTETPFENTSAPREVMNDVAEQIKALVRKCRVDRRKIIGVGVGASGLVNYHTGVNLLAANFGWRDVPMREWLAEKLDLPVVVDNNVRCMALGEAVFGVGRGVNTLAFVYGRYGVGAGLVVGGQVIRGSGLGAGEIGHTVMIPHGGQLCRCGQRGCLETLVSETALVREAQQLAEAHPQSALAAALRASHGGRPIQRVFAAARAGDSLAVALVTRSAEYLGIALANLVNLINPELILLGGLFADEQELILPVAQATMEATAFAGLGRKARLQATSFGWQAGMIGAATLALTQLFYQNSEE